MIKRIVFPALLAATMVFLSGCFLFQGEQERPADITLEELFKLQSQATDPSGAFAKAESFILRQVIITPGLLFGETRTLMTTIYRKPDMFKLTTTDSTGLHPITEVIFNGREAIVADYKRRVTAPVTGAALEQVKASLVFSMPGGDLYSVFKNIDLVEVTIDDVDYYKMICTPISEEVPVFNIYVDKLSYVTRMVKTADYQVTVDSYGNYDDMLIQERCTTVSGDVTTTSQLVYFRIGIQLPENAFAFPTF